MANPRKFSEKIALLNQKQAEGTAAFEAILRDVSQATRGHVHTKQNQQLHIQQNIMQQYRGGSLPNVNQISTNTGMDIQTLQHMEGIRGQQSRIDRIYPRDRVRQQIGPLRSRPSQMEKSRADCSPYGCGAYLSPPPDTSWRRTNSDSAIHSSSMGAAGTDLPSPNTPPMHRRIHEVVGENSVLSTGTYPWDPKKLQQQRPKSCEVPNINIYPSTEQEQDMQLHIPVANNTGSLPDLTILQFPSPLTTPLDVEDQQTYNNDQSNLSPTSAHHINMGPAQLLNGSPGQSPSSQRWRANASGPSPLVLQGNGNQAMHVPLSPPVSNLDPSRLHMDSRIWQQYVLHVQQQQQRGQHGIHGPISSQQGHGSSPTHSSHSKLGLIDSPPQAVHPSRLRPVPKVCVTSHENGPPEPSLTQYRHNMSDTNCQSPTSPQSQSSYSPSQSPGLPNSTWNNSMFEMDQFHLQQQPQTNAIQNVQQQFEHFNMHQVSNDISGTSGIIITSSSLMPYSQGNSHNLCTSLDYSQQQQQQNFYFDNQSSESHGNSSQQNTLNSSTSCNNKIPHIILTGMSDGSFDTDFFSTVSDEALKDGLVPLDLDGLQMLTDPSLVTDADTENSFRLDQL